jgi:phage tail tape-measure protein
MSTTNDHKTTSHDADKNPDPITGNPGSHPAGTGIGAASGAATGAAVGSLGGPVGTVIGGVAGAVVGGLVGHGIGEAVDPTEDAYWRDEHAKQPYASNGAYDDYEPAYRLGYNAGSTEGDYDQDALKDRYNEGYRGDSKMEFDQAEPATRAAFDRRRAQASA